jgi:hypothetical protein
METRVKVVIPVYKPCLSSLEYRSLRQACGVLGGYPLVLVKPASLDVSYLLREYPAFEVMSFSDEYFRSISSYNRLMLSSEFYASFAEVCYILIYQLDAYVFRDELSYWCDCGYDYIGAPWLERPVYSWYMLPNAVRLLPEFMRGVGWRDKRMLYDKVGNGGLSLRRVSVHLESIALYGDRISFIVRQRRYHLYNEDVFWSTLPAFRYPSVSEALRFSFDKYPRYCYELTNHRLPFGCHGWYSRKMKRFWKPIIG